MRERTYLSKVLTNILADGWSLESVDDGDDQPVAVSTVSQAVVACEAVDEAYVMFTKAEGKRAWVFVVWQNQSADTEEAPEVICDYTTNLSDVIEEMAA